MDGDRTYTRYKLRAVIEHIGETMGGGHYAAMTKPDLIEGKLWFRYNDTLREPMSWKQVKQHQAYLLLYEKVNGSPVLNNQKTVIDETNETKQPNAASPRNEETIYWKQMVYQ